MEKVGMGGWVVQRRLGVGGGRIEESVAKKQNKTKRKKSKKHFDLFDIPFSFFFDSVATKIQIYEKENKQLILKHGVSLHVHRYEHLSTPTRFLISCE